MLRLEAPPLSGADYKERLTDYLISLNEKLTYLLNNLSEENFSADTAKVFAETRSAAAEAAKKTAALESSAAESRETLRNEIIKTAQDVRRDYSSSLDTAKGSIMATVAEEYTAKSGAAELKSLLQSMIEQTSRDVTLKFSEANSYAVQVEGALQSYMDEVRSYIRFSSEGIELGNADSPFLARLGSSRLSFLQDGREVAYISNNRLYITDAEAGSLGISGLFGFKTEANGSLSLFKRG